MILWCIWNKGKPNGKNDGDRNENTGHNMIWNGCPAEDEGCQNPNIPSQMAYTPKTSTNPSISKQ